MPTTERQEVTRRLSKMAAILAIKLVDPEKRKARHESAIVDRVLMRLLPASSGPTPARRKQKRRRKSIRVPVD